MFRQKEYKPVGPKPDPLDIDPKFACGDFQSIYGSVKTFSELKNQLWSGVHYSIFFYFHIFQSQGELKIFFIFRKILSLRSKISFCKLFLIVLK